MSVAKTHTACCICGSLKCDPQYPDELGNNLPAVEYDFTPDTRKTFAIVKCSQCGHIYTNPMPHLDDVYKNSQDEVYQANKPQRIKCFGKILELILKHKSGGDLLDVGCATGLLLDVASSKFRTSGVELSEWSRRQCDARHSVHSSLEQCSGQRFDVITMLGVIEHIADPDVLMANIASLLKPNGLFVVYTGDVEALLPRILKKKWWWYQGMHLHYFSQRTLEMLCSKHTIEVIHAGRMPLYFSLESLSTSLKRYATLHSLLAPVLEHSAIRNIMVPMPLSGEMLLIGRIR